MNKRKYNYKELNQLAKQFCYNVFKKYNVPVITSIEVIRDKQCTFSSNKIIVEDGGRYIDNVTEMYNVLAYKLASYIVDRKGYKISNKEEMKFYIEKIKTEILNILNI